MKNVQSSLKKESHNEYRSRAGRTSRYQHLMNQKVDSSQRRVEIERLSKATIRVEKKVKNEIEEFCQEAPTVRHRQKQITYDKARGAYESRTFLEGTLRLKGIEPAESIEEMKAQYENWKILASDGDLPDNTQSWVTVSGTHSKRQTMGASA